MKILIPSRPIINPYLSQFIEALKRRPEVTQVDLQMQHLEMGRGYDVAIIQWPEAFIDFQAATQADCAYIKSIILGWRQAGVKILAIVHNTKPHRRVTEYSKLLYEIVYTHADAIIHFGETSKKLLAEELELQITPDKEFVVPHGNYNSLMELEADNYSAIKKKLKLPPGKKIILVLGQLRKDAELELVFQLSQAAQKVGAFILFAGRLPYNNRRTLLYYKCRLKIYIQANLRFIERVFSDSEIRSFVELSDILFVPRLDSLNSGNVALGFTFGKVVLGPNFGVIGEELKQTGNPTFEITPYNVSPQYNLLASVEDALRKSDLNYGKHNFHYSQTVLNWDSIAKKYIEIIKSLQ